MSIHDNKEDRTVGSWNSVNSYKDKNYALKHAKTQAKLKIIQLKRADEGPITKRVHY
jgi:hypothetical protein